jgi:PII-like signaling protein
MVLKEMLCLMIRLKKNDETNGKRTEKQIIDLLIKSKLLGATVWLGIDGFGKRGRSTMHIEGVMINQPMLIEVVDEKEKIEPLLIKLKRMIGDNGLITIHEVKIV